LELIINEYNVKIHHKLPDCVRKGEHL